MSCHDRGFSGDDARTVLAQVGHTLTGCGQQCQREHGQKHDKEHSQDLVEQIAVRDRQLYERRYGAGPAGCVVTRGSSRGEGEDSEVRRRSAAAVPGAGWRGKGMKQRSAKSTTSVPACFAFRWRLGAGRRGPGGSVRRAKTTTSGAELLGLLSACLPGAWGPRGGEGKKQAESRNDHLRC